MSILIVGADGNMGRRYRAICGYLDIACIGVDKSNALEEVMATASFCDGIIVATPTDTHCQVIKDLLPLKKPILCEKPFTKDLYELRETLDMARRANAQLSMVYQYRELVARSSVGWSHYNYYKHGSDGLVWDCIQIIGLAKGVIDLENDSPIWKCTINEKPIDVKHMDYAYVKFVRNWLKQPADDLGVIREIHEKTYNMARSWGSNGRNY